MRIVVTKQAVLTFPTANRSAKIRDPATIPGSKRKAFHPVINP